MGKAKEEMMERQQDAAVARALNIEVSELEGYPYRIEEDHDRSGAVIRRWIVWEDEVPEGVFEVEYDDDVATTPIGALYDEEYQDED